MPHETLTLSRADLMGVVQEIVGGHGAASSGPKLAAAEVDRDAALKAGKRVKFWAGFICAAVVSTSGGLTWVYSRGEQAQAAASHETSQDHRIQTNAAQAAANSAHSIERDKLQGERIRNLGALQIEQGNDQRRILIKSAPKAVRAELAEKPETLKKAEGAVLRD